MSELRIECAAVMSELRIECAAMMSELKIENNRDRTIRFPIEANNGIMGSQ